MPILIMIRPPLYANIVAMLVRFVRMNPIITVVVVVFHSRTQWRPPCVHSQLHIHTKSSRGFVSFAFVYKIFNINSAKASSNNHASATHNLFAFRREARLPRSTDKTTD